MTAPRALGFAIAICACHAAESRTTVTTEPIRPEPAVTALVAPVAPIALVAPTAKTCVALTRELRGVPPEGTFMLTPETTMHLDVGVLGGADASSMEQAFAQTVEPWIGNDPPSFTSKIKAASATHYAFDAHGRTAGYATCHGEYEDFTWRGSFDVSDGNVTAFALAGSGTVTEDICSAKNGGATRDVTGRYSATYTATLTNTCED